MLKLHLTYPFIAENMFAFMLKWIGKQDTRPRNRQQLIDLIQAAWRAISDEKAKTLTDSFKKRLEACIANGGDITKY